MDGYYAVYPPEPAALTEYLWRKFMKKLHQFLTALPLIIIFISGASGADLKIDKKKKSALLTVGTTEHFRQQALKALLSSLVNAGSGDFVSVTEADFIRDYMKSINTGKEKFTYSSGNNFVTYKAAAEIKKVKHEISSEAAPSLKDAAAHYLSEENAAGTIFTGQAGLREAVIKKIADKHHAEILKPEGIEIKKDTVYLKVQLPGTAPSITCAPEIAGGFTLALNIDKKIPLKTAAEIRAGFESVAVKSGTAAVKGLERTVITADILNYTETKTGYGASFITRGDIVFTVKEKPVKIKSASAPVIVSEQKAAFIPEGSSIITAAAAGEKVFLKITEMILDELCYFNIPPASMADKSATQKTQDSSISAGSASTFCVEYIPFSGQKQNKENYAVFKTSLTGKLIAGQFTEKPCSEAGLKISVELYPAYAQKGTASFKSFRTFCIIRAESNGRIIVSEIISEPGVGLADEVAVKNSAVKCADTASAIILKAVRGK